MNNIRIFGMIVFTILFTGCSTEEESDLVGTWDLSQLKVTCTNGETYDFTAQNGCYFEETVPVCLSLTFAEDGKVQLFYSYDGEENTSQFTFTTTTDQVTLCDSSMECDIFQIANGTLVLTDSQGDCEERYVFAKR